MDANIFAVSQRYANPQWEYEVLELNGAYMVVRSDDGQIRTLQVETAARVWNEMQATAKRRASRKRAAPRLKAGRDSPTD